MHLVSHCLLIIGVGVAFAGCQAVRYDANDPKALHHIGSDIHGAYEPFINDDADRNPEYRQPWENAYFPPEAKAANKEIFDAYSDLLDRIEQKMLKPFREDSDAETLKVVLWLHGGLNRPKNNDKLLDRHLNELIEDGYYPIFVSWRSGAFKSVADRYWRVRDGGLAMGPLAPARGVFYFGTDLLTGVAQLPETLWDQGANLIGRRGLHPVIRDSKDIRWKAYFEGAEPIALWEGGENFTRPERAFYATKQIIPGTVRLVTTPLTQGLGTPAWQMMVRRSKNLLTMEADALNLEDGYGLSPSRKLVGDGVVAVLARRLRSIEDELLEDGRNLEIVLVGHSMGAIVANDLVEAFPDLPYSRIIHMASADSVRNWVDKTAPWLVANPQAKFYNVTLHPVHEEREDFSVISALPEGSLLVWLDSMFTKPDHIMDRRSGRWTNARNLLPLYADLPYARLKVLELNGHDPRKHGGFGELKFWREETYWK